MNAGDLDQRITIQAATVTRDAHGGEIPTWVSLATVWASKAHKSSREFFAAQKMNSEITDLFIVRFRHGLNAKMRVLHFGNTYDLIGTPCDPDGKRQELQLLCKAVT